MFEQISQDVFQGFVRLQPFSLNPKNLYYNLLPVIRPDRKNVEKFLSNAIFFSPTHSLSKQSENLIIEYELFALTRYIDKTQKPYFMNKELEQIKTDVYILEGDKDLLFPHVKSISNAKRLISTIKDIKIFHGVGHGIETYCGVMEYIREKMDEY